jgi:hypothetical protein
VIGTGNAVVDREGKTGKQQGMGGELSRRQIQQQMRRPAF